jgi:hypothetical protein
MSAAGATYPTYQGHRISGPSHLAGPFLHRPYFFPSFLRKQESMQPLGNPERLDSCLRRNDGGWERHGAVLLLSAARLNAMALVIPIQRFFAIKIL